MSTLVGMGSSINSCRFERPMAYYHDEIQPLYGSFNSHMNGLADVALQVDFPVYGNGPTDVGIQNQWPLGFGSNLCLPGDGYAFHMAEYPHLVCGVDGYTVLQHSNGH
ncbi:hypothetical protein L1049_019577 [Liquidambar formosana]|uniref:Uncharacterized protein n=1 Tax=Liquidambar formosana TaxID=63359 RepID=A0AAP0S8D0_LIQFO